MNGNLYRKGVWVLAVHPRRDSNEFKDDPHAVFGCLMAQDVQFNSNFAECWSEFCELRVWEYVIYFQNYNEGALFSNSHSIVGCFGGIVTTLFSAIGMLLLVT